MRLALITPEQAEALNGKPFGQNSFCNPVLDGLARWVISLAEAEALGVQYEVVEYIATESDELAQHGQLPG